MHETGSNGLFKMDLSKYERIVLPRKEMLYSEGKSPRFLYCLQHGKIKCVRVHEEGKEFISDLYSIGDYIGYTAILLDEVYQESAVALVDSELIRIPRAEFEIRLIQDQQVSALFIRILLKNQKDKQDRLLNMAYGSLRKRVAIALMDFHDKFPKMRASHTLGVTREDIARYVGTATESLIRTLSDFKSEKLIEVVDGKIHILEPEKLRHLLY